MTRIILHGHFYQPSRENPWTGGIDTELSAQPFHDWNERIDYECYRPNAFGRVVDAENRVRSLVNNFEWISFNVGPTLWQWLERHDRTTVERMREADRASLARLGHGNAIAQSYNHTILPLDNERDRRTQIRWGLAAFRSAFGREAEALWLPETAANHEVLDELIEHGLAFAVLAPQQAARTRPLPGGSWEDVSAETLDVSRTYLYRHGDGSDRSLAIFFYDGDLARQLGFGDALRSTRKLWGAIESAAGRGSRVHAALDGETFGHHHAWGDRVLAHALAVRAVEGGVSRSNYAAELEAHPPKWEVQLALGEGGRGSSWSCAHGVERWRADCGCRIDTGREAAQGWRSPLRASLELLRDQGAAFYEELGSQLLREPWSARDHYIELILEPKRRRAWLSTQGLPGLGRAEAKRAIELLEFQRQAMLMFTSCGWFFDDVAGIESRIVLRHALRAMKLWRELGGEPPEQAFREMLRAAESADPRFPDGEAVFDDVRRTIARAKKETQRSDQRERLRLALEGELMAAMAAGSWGAAEDYVTLAERLKLSDQLFRAQEAYLVAQPPKDAERALRIGRALGFAPGLLSSRAEDRT